jgi:Fungal chitosanase of glycosyl hydrolase group 75
MENIWSDVIKNQITSASEIPHQYEPDGSIIKLLNNGVLYIKSDMDTDSDGSPRALELDGYGQLETSLSWDNGWQGENEYVNAETISYYVLPLKFADKTGISCHLGDLALLRWQGKEVFAIFADEGPEDKLGEGSILAVESLGENPWNHTKTKIISGIPFGVEYIIFPESTSSRSIPSSFKDIQSVGLEVFHEYFGEREYSITSEEMQAKAGENDIEVWEIMNAPKFKTLTDLNLRSNIGTDYSLITIIPRHTVVKSMVNSKSQVPKVLNVGFGNSGLWIKIDYENRKGFVRDSKDYMLPWYQE